MTRQNQSAQKLGSGTSRDNVVVKLKNGTERTLLAPTRKTADKRIREMFGNRGQSAHHYGKVGIVEIIIGNKPVFKAKNLTNQRRESKKFLPHNAIAR